MVITLCKKGKYTYVLSKTEIKSEDFGIAAVYGISIIGKTENAVLEDISENFSFVQHLFELVVDGELYPEHLYDVVEDYLHESNPKTISFTKEREHPYIA